MLKLFVTLARGLARRSTEEVLDHHAVIILDQQIADCATAVEASRRALAIAIAQDRSEAKRAQSLRDRIADLEGRAVAAIQGGREDLAQEAAEAIAPLEADLQATDEACRRFADEAKRLRRTVADAERRLANLERGRRTAQAAEAVRRLRETAAAAGTTASSPLAEAEATLRRLQQQQAEAEAASEALDELDTDRAAETVTEKLADQGFGPRLKPTADDVLERLRRRAGDQTRSDSADQ